MLRSAFCGYETQLLGQGQGRVPDGRALDLDNSYGVIWDGKVRSDGYSMGTDDRVIREYIMTQSRELKRRRSLRNIYYAIISSRFRDDYDDVICMLKMDTDVNEVVLVEAEALVALVDMKLRDPRQLTLGPDGLQRLFTVSGIVTAEMYGRRWGDWSERHLSRCPFCRTIDAPQMKGGLQDGQASARRRVPKHTPEARAKWPPLSEAEDATRGETPLTDSVLANAPAGAKPSVCTLSWESGFAVGVGTVHKFTEGLRVWLFRPDFHWDGQAWPCSVDLVRWAEDGETVLEIKERRLFKTEAEANAAMNRWAEEIHAQFLKDRRLPAPDHGPRPSLDEQDLENARLQVMREQYPNTFKALEDLRIANEVERPAKMETVFRGYAVDRVRLDKPSKLPNVTPLTAVPQDMNFILDIAKAYKAKSPYDRVDVEIAANWFAAGYDKMSLADYTRAINAKTGKKLKPETMRARRYKKFGLMTKKQPGPAPKS